MTICLLTEVKLQWAMLVHGWVTLSLLDQLWDVSKLEFLSVTRPSSILVHFSYLCGFGLALGNQNTFWPCLRSFQECRGHTMTDS